MLCMYNRFELSGNGTDGNETEISDSTGTPKASTNNQTPSFDSTVPPTNVTSSNVTKVVSTTTGPGKSFMNLALFKIVQRKKTISQPFPFYIRYVFRILALDSSEWGTLS